MGLEETSPWGWGPEGRASSSAMQVPGGELPASWGGFCVPGVAGEETTEQRGSPGVRSGEDWGAAGDKNPIRVSPTRALGER